MNKKEILEQVASGTIHVDEALRELQKYESNTMINKYMGERLERLRTRLEPYVETTFYDELDTFDEISYSELVKLVEEHISKKYLVSMGSIGLELEKSMARNYAIHDVSLDFARGMLELDIEGVDARSLLKARIHDITPATVEAFKQLDVRGSLSQYIKMAIHNVDSEFVLELSGLDLGLVMTPNSLVKLRIQGVSAKYIRDLQKVGIQASLNEYRKMAVHGVDAVYVNEMSQLGLGDLSTKDFIKMKIHGLEPNGVSEFRSVFADITLNEILMFAINGIDVRFVEGFRELGYTDITPRELKSLRIHGVDSSMVASLQSIGFPDLPIMKVVKMAVHGVTADFAKKLGMAGMEDLSVNELIQFKVHGIGPRFVAKVIAIGYEPTPQQLVHLRIHGVSIEDIAHGYIDGMSLQQVVRYYR